MTTDDTVLERLRALGSEPASQGDVPMDLIRRVRRRRVASALAFSVAGAIFLALLVLSLGVLLPLGRGPESTERPATDTDVSSSPEGPASDVAAAPFMPSVERDGNLLRIPVIFPDGTNVTLVFPEALGLSDMPVQPDVSYSLDDRYGGQIVFLHDPEASIGRFVDPDKGSMLINSSAGGLEVFSARNPERSWIRYELPTWTVLVPFEMEASAPAEDRVAAAVEVASSLDVHESSSGFPIVTASGDAWLAEGFGEAGGAQLAFGDESAEPDMVSQLDATIFLSPDGCDPGTVQPAGGGYGSACLGGGRVFASIYGDREFVTAVQEELTVEVP